jgi:hypothetical protein
MGLRAPAAVVEHLRIDQSGRNKWQPPAKGWPREVPSLGNNVHDQLEAFGLVPLAVIGRTPCSRRHSSRRQARLEFALRAPGRD